MPSYVYIFQHSREFKGTPKGWHTIKVGKANNTDSRHSQGKTWSPYGLTLIKKYRFPSEKMALSAEHYIHKRFGRYLTNPKDGGTEWFEIPINKIIEIHNHLNQGDPFPWLLKFKLWRIRKKLTMNDLNRIWKSPKTILGRSGKISIGLLSLAC